MLRIAIVEDEQDAAHRLEACLLRYQEEAAVSLEPKWFQTAVDFLGEYHAGDFDVIFMDVDMPEMNGMEASHVLRERDQKVVLIFVTNLAQYAIEGYEVNALDFVLKPINYYSFKLKIQKALNAVASRSETQIRLHRQGGTHYLKTADIQYIEVQNHDLIYHTVSENIVVSGSLSTAQRELNNDCFFRCNYCYLVNLYHVSKVEGIIATVGGDELQISRSRRKEFLQRLSLYYGKGGR